MLTANNLPPEEQTYFDRYMSNQPDTNGHNGMGALQFVIQNVKARFGVQLRTIDGNHENVCPSHMLSEDNQVLIIYVSNINKPDGIIQLLYWYFEKCRPELTFSPVFAIHEQQIVFGEEVPAIEYMDQTGTSMRLTKIFLKILETE